MLSGYSNMIRLSTSSAHKSIYPQTHPSTPSSSRCRAICTPLGPRKFSSYSGARMPVSSAVLSTFTFRDLSRPLQIISTIPKSRRSQTIVKASKDVPLSDRYPPMTKKPNWWWRTLACLPYLMPLHTTWMYAETSSYHLLEPFLQNFELLTNPFLQVIGKLPKWFPMAYLIIAYLGIVRRKEWPHFIRFHVVMGWLLEVSLQVTVLVSRGMPQGICRGLFGMHFWIAFGFGFLFTVLECMRCALADACILLASLQTPKILPSRVHKDHQ